MVQSKVRYELITDEHTRRETFKKRKIGFIKKMDEIKTLCGIDACAVVLNEDGSPSEVWPSQPETMRAIEKFNSLSATSQTINMTDHVGFLGHNLTKVTNNLDKETKQVRSLEMELLLADCIEKDAVDVSNPEDLHEMLSLLESKIQVVDWMIEDIENTPFTSYADAKEAVSEPNHGKGKQPHPF